MKILEIVVIALVIIGLKIMLVVMFPTIDMTLYMFFLGVTHKGLLKSFKQPDEPLCSSFADFLELL